jgi:hypothetical protein
MSIESFNSSSFEGSNSRDAYWESSAGLLGDAGSIFGSPLGG